MPIPVPQAAADHGQLAVAKAKQARDLPRYLWSSMLAGAYVGLAVVLLVSVSAPLAASGNPGTKLVQGAVFGLALTLVVFAGGELATGNMMVMTQGALGRVVSWPRAVAVCAASLAGNAIGSIGLALVIHGTGAFTSGPAADLVESTVAGKDALTGPQLFWRAVLCNALVCLGLWMAARTRSDAAKLVVLWWALLAFISSGFEHSVANMTLFAIALFGQHPETVTVGGMFYNLLWVSIGNIIAGAGFVASAYWLANGRTAAPAAATTSVTVAAE